MSYIRIGSVDIHMIEDYRGLFVEPHEVFGPQPEHERFHWSEHPDVYCHATGRLRIAVRTFLLRTAGGRNVLVDTGIGCDKSDDWITDWCKRSDQSWLTGLEQAGVSPADVDLVICTHLHLDHCGWNTVLKDRAWVPTFPNATYVFPERDLDMCQHENGPVYRENLLPILEAGKFQLIDREWEVETGIRLVPALGHSPGQMVVWVSGPSSKAVISADTFHYAAQARNPHWKCRFDWDPNRAVVERKKLFEQACREEAMVLTSHLLDAAPARIVAHGNAFEIEPYSDQEP